MTILQQINNSIEYIADEYSEITKMKDIPLFKDEPNCFVNRSWLKEKMVDKINDVIDYWIDNGIFDGGQFETQIEKISKYVDEEHYNRYDFDTFLYDKDGNIIELYSLEDGDLSEIKEQLKDVDSNYVLNKISLENLIENDYEFSKDLKKAIKEIEQENSKTQGR